MRTLAFAFAALLLVAACDGSPGPDAGAPPGDAATADAGVTVDAGPSDAGRADASAPDAAADAGPADGGAAVGRIGGACGTLDAELTSPTPHFVQATATYPDGWTADGAGLLSAGAQEILAEGTAGGSSGYSEAFAFEVLQRCEGASLVKSETEIEYTAEGASTDMLVAIDGTRVGVSVTRAVNVTGACTREDAYSEARARDLLADKLADVLESTANVAPADAWTKQILFVWADTATAAASLMSAWDALDASLRADTVIFVAVSEGMDAFLYFEDRC
jgi:hypothetical protein